MSADKKEIELDSGSVDFLSCDEYEMVSSDDVLAPEDLHFNQNDSADNLIYNQVLSSVKQYEEEWNELYRNEELDFEKLQKKATEGQLKTSRFRSVCWRCLLGILHNQPKQWIYQLKMYRKHYDEICIELEQNPWNVKGSNPSDNPLSQESDSIWQRYFCDEELKAMVYQDVKRTFPGMEFFRRKDIQDMMVRILFCYARQNHALCYRQGMHEILAPLIFILHCDQQAFLHAKEQIQHLDEDISEILNPQYLEQDAYSIFKCIMSHIECSYRLNLMTTTEESFPPETLFENKFSKEVCQNEVISRLDYIKTSLLQPKDPELNDHLQKLDIPLHLFGLRCLRLLFGREFPLQDLLVLWDFIFSNSFETVNFIIVAMLIAIRQILLNGDYTDSLSQLMRYPSGVDVNFVINYALHLKDPQKYTCPDISRSFYHPPSASAKSKPSQKNANTQSQLNRRPKKGPSGPSQYFYEKPNFLSLGNAGEGDGASVSGCAAHDPKVLKAELEQTKTVLNVVGYKLLQFHSVLTTSLASNISTDVQGALDGIFELTCLIDGFSRHNSYEIETACEAGETKESKTQNIGFVSQQLKKKIESPEGSINSDSKSHTLPKMKKGPKFGELKVFKHHIGGTIQGVPMTDPLHLIKNLIQDETLDTATKSLDKVSFLKKGLLKSCQIKSHEEYLWKFRIT